MPKMDCCRWLNAQTMSPQQIFWTHDNESIFKFGKVKMVGTRNSIIHMLTCIFFLLCNAYEYIHVKDNLFLIYFTVQSSRFSKILIISKMFQTKLTLFSMGHPVVNMIFQMEPFSEIVKLFLGIFFHINQFLSHFACNSI